ncbi:MAG: TonB-dependent receptor [Pseudomonadota bacterium]
MRKNRIVFWAAVAIVPIGLWPQLAAAQGQDSGSARAGLDEIIITARKKEESIQDAPLAVSALSDAQLKNAGVDSFDQVLSLVPNASQSGGIGGSIQGLVSIRGISTLVRFVGLETGVGFYVDGVYMGRPENFNQDLIDIERIEVLRGPQGAVFGKNTIAGAINIITKMPGDETTAIVEAQYGNYDHTRLRGYLSGALSETVSASISAGYLSRDGFVEHLTDGKDLDDADQTTLRAKLRFAPVDWADFVLAADYLKDDSNPAFFEVTDFAFAPFATPEDQASLSSPFTTNNEFENSLDRTVQGLSLTSGIDLAEGSVDVVLAYRESDWQASLDDDKTSLEIFPDRFSQETEVLSAEVRYSRPINDKLDVMVGAYYYDQNSSGIGDFALGDFLVGVPGVNVPIVLTSSVESDSTALFFNTNYSLTDQLSLEVGGRWLRETKDAIHVQQDFSGIFGDTSFQRSRTDNDFSPTVSMSYFVNDANTLYARYGEGFKSAGFNTDFVTAGVSNLEVAPELATSVELGWKSTLANGRVRLNTAIFTTEYEDLQLAQIVGGGVSLNNAAEATITGLETEFVAALGEFVNLNASLGLLDATYDDFAGCPAPGSTPPAIVAANCSGNTLNLAPEVSIALGMQWTYPVGHLGNLFLRADYNYRDDVFFEPQNDPRLSGGSRDLIDFRAGLVNDTWELIAWARNLGDENYVNFADDRSAIGIPTTQAFGAPRTYGVTARFRF